MAIHRVDSILYHFNCCFATRLRNCKRVFYLVLTINDYLCALCLTNKLHMNGMRLGDLSLVHEGVHTAAEIIGSTLGVLGKAVFIDEGIGIGHMIDDGATVANKLQTFKGTREMLLGIGQVLNACNRVVEVVGDGTTTTALLCSAFLRHYEKTGVDVSTSSLKKFHELVTEFIASNTRKIETLEDLQSVANLACGDEELGKLCADAVWAVGGFGQVGLSETSETNISLEVRDGISWGVDAAIPHQLFAEGTKRITLDSDTSIFICNGTIESEKQMQQIYEAYVKSTKGRKSPLVIVSSGVMGIALQYLFENNRAFMESKGQKGLPVICVKLPQWTPDEMSDVLAVLGLTLVGEGGKPIARVNEKDFSVVSRFEGTRQGVHLGLDEESTKRCKARLEVLEADGVEGIRISRLRSGSVHLNIGGESDTQRQRLKGLAEDAILACQSAMRSGVVNGGGHFFFLLAKEFPAYESVFKSILTTLFKERENDALIAFEHSSQFDLVTERAVNMGTFLEPAPLYLESIKVSSTTALELRNAGRVLVWDIA